MNRRLFEQLDWKRNLQLASKLAKELKVIEFITFSLFHFVDVETNKPLIGEPPIFRISSTAGAYNIE